MKRQFFVVCMLLLSLFSWEGTYAKVADSKHIILIGREHSGRPRSIAPVQAWLDETGVYVAFYVPVDKATVRIIDQTGAVVEETEAVAPETLRLALPEAGSYTIEILYEDMFYYGTFDSVDPTL